LRWEDKKVALSFRVEMMKMNAFWLGSRKMNCLPLQREVRGAKKKLPALAELSLGDSAKAEELVDQLSSL
jgi:hypothetical protein